ncbi:hypothetical protein B6S44_09420 [Bosea sp. Tri-44]|uniref:peroxidase family protein n=1 Tax=Bosea sp. Tri-44 TaxID=1972137 RepID=UPI0010279216|nr:peroxidase family protein [Bosea sp. Tri-44]RXT55619.1 hypothetical protein B6S44_09420 [Bosea sp. Tri-44]
MVTYIRSDLDFILAQIKIAEAHAAGQPLYGPGGLIPSYNVAWGLRTVDGSFNHLLPGQERWGASDREFVELMDPSYRPADGTPFDPDGPGPAPAMPTSPNYNPSNNPNSLVFDSSLRTISNLLVDQSLGNPAAILTGLQNAGVEDPGLVITGQISAAYAPLKPLFKALAEAERAEASAAAAAAANPGNAALQQAAADAAADLAAAQSAVDAGAGPVASGGTGLYDLLALHGIEMDGANVHIPNTAPDEGLSAPFNSWFTLFGQFFDHGLDLVNKGGSGTVFVPLQPDDPLWDPTPGAPNFMVLTRATVTAGADNVMGTADDVRPMNTTTAFVDQNQTYSSHASHQVFLRQYVATANGPVATGHLIEGANGGMATWGEVKAQAATLLGIQLTDLDVGRVPLLRTDAYGNFIAGSNGYPLVITGVGSDGIPNTADDVVIQGDPTANGGLGISIVSAIRTNAAFLADIAHTAVPEGLADGDTEIGGNIPEDGTYDDELLNAHFIAGDGRANENIGLTAVHHVFHSEHNRLVEHTKATVLATGDAAFIAEWQNPDGSWNGERLFQAAKFGTEMQYQHLVFEEFARKVQPTINTFLVPDGFDTMMDPSIFAEFAHVVYRFGHSMLTESIDQFGPTFQPNHISLIQGFLNPTAFTSANGIADGIAAGAIVRGMTRQVGNEIDEFVTGALRNNLLGLPLDLATINLARGRDTGVPALNEARRTFYEATNQDARLKPYESWIDYAGHLKHEASIINFIAAYGTHQLITDQTTIEGKRDAALTIITGVSVGGFLVPADAEAFLNGTGAYAADLGGLENVDLWIGGLAEEVMPFGGMLGATFNFVFEQQMELLQSGDRFYYLQRLDGLHLFGEMENNSFAAMIMRNTDATHLPSDVFSTPGLILEVDQTKQFNDSNGDGILDSLDPVGPGLLTQLVVRNSPNNLRYNGDEHVVLGGTEAANVLIAGIGDDTLFGDGGNDRLEGGFGNDILNGGAGDYIIVDSGGDDNIKAGDGNDVVHAGPGLDLVMGGAGQDFVFLGTDEGSEVFAGEGNDFIYGNRNAERILGNEGNDWIETGTFDGAPGDNFDEIFAHDGIDGHDVFLGDGGFDEFIGEGGDDIMVGSTGRGKMAGMSGFDWATYKDSAVGTTGVTADLSIPIIFDEAPVIPANAALDEYQSMEGLSGSAGNDILKGSNILADERLPFHPVTNPTPLEGYRGSQLTKESLQLIAGLAEVLGLTPAQVNAMAAGAVAFNAGDIILGGDGSDVIQGNAGDDIIDGDKWLNVRISVRENIDGTGPEIETHNSMTTLAAKMFSGQINPGQLVIVREIITTGADAIPDIDTAKFRGGRGEYAFSATADGQVIVSHVVEDSLDGTDRLRNIERVEFLAGGPLNIIVGTPGNDVPLNGTAQDDLILGLAGADTLNGLAGDDILVGGAGATTTTSATYADNFNNNSFGNSTGSAAWDPDWFETGDTGVTTGQIRIDDGNNTLRIVGGAASDGATITRPINLTAAATATITFSANPDNLDAGESVIAEFTADGSTWVTIATITGNGGNQPYTHSATGPFPNASIRFVASAINEAVEVVNIDDLVISFTTVTTNTGVDTLNGGLGNDTYSFTLGDGNDGINEAVNATSGGTADRTSILAPSTGNDVDGLPILTLNSLSASDNNTADNTGSLVINYGLPNGAATVNQTITVAGHYTGTNAETGVERINFNGANYAGYVLGTDDYFISRGDVARDSGGVNMSTNAVTNAQQNFVAGEDGVNDIITGGALNDLIFGGTGNNRLLGNDGDDLLVGGAGVDVFDVPADDTVDPGPFQLGADTMVGLAGNDIYGVDDLLDVVVEAAGQGTDTVETRMAALSIEAMANVENLTYTGLDADQFVGTGNSLANVITGGDLADTLSGLGGNDTLQGGLGADTMIGGDGTDTYFVDDAGDVVSETNADLVLGGNDLVESDVDFTLGANVERLDLNSDAIRGTGNALANVINGNDEANQLFGAGGNDTLAGNDGNDLLDGGDGDDTLNGGDDNDTIIGGAGTDIIDVGGGFNTIVYNAPGFGNDTINSFDNAGGAATNQDKIDLSGLGVTAANFATRVFESASGGNTVITIREGGAASPIQGTILITGSGTAAIDITDFTLAAAAPTSTITGTNAANTRNGVGTTVLSFKQQTAYDIVNANGGNDVVNGGEGADTLNGGDGNDTLSGGFGATTGSMVDNFGAVSYANNNGNFAFAGNWDETGDNDSATNGDILITGGRLTFAAGTDNNDTIERAINLTGATAPTLSFDYQAVALDAGETVVVQALNGATWETLGTLGGTTTTTFSSPLNPAHSAIRFVATGGFEAGETFHIDNLVVALGPNSGVDTVNGGTGDDTIIWNANAAAPTDGRDIVDGGTEGAAGDTFVINGNASVEAFTIYTRAAWLAVAGNVAANLAAATEIVVTRNGSNNAAVIAELAEIEEVRINGVDPSGTGGGAGGDTFTIVGDFSTTSLRLNTITIDGDAGDDTIDISALSSAHRIVFRSNGGNDTIIGALRPEDVIELPNGATLADYESTTDANGVTTLTNGESSITYTAVGDGPQVGEDDEDDDDEDDDDDDDDDCDDDDDEAGTPAPTGGGNVRVGTASGDVLLGTSGGDSIIGLAGDDVLVGEAGDDAISGGDGADFVEGGAGRDTVQGGAGDDHVFAGAGGDLVHGEAGADRLFGQGGNDVINAGAGDDAAFGGAGNDLFVGEVGDGNDTYYGDEIDGGNGVDTLDLSAISANLTVDLGNGMLGRGSAVSSQSGSDTLWHIENVATGSGNDTITAGHAVNVMEGGAGDDVFRFTDVESADGDTILDFQLGDLVDLSGIDANGAVAGNQNFTLLNGSAFTAAAQLMVSYEERDGVAYTIVSGNVSGDAAEEFRIELKGSHNLTASNFVL